MMPNRLYEIIEGETPLFNSEIYTLKAVIDERPYFQQGLYIYLRAIYGINRDFFKKELERLSMFVTDRKALFYYIFKEEYDFFFKKTGQKEIPADKTSLLLEAFFETAPQDSQLEYEITGSTIATTDYLQFAHLDAKKSDIPLEKISDDKIEEESSEEVNHHKNLIDNFIKQSEKGIHINIDRELKDIPIEVDEKEQKGEELDEDMFFTETLAKIYIKQKRYDKAYKIIKHLSLNYPKKNVYFADQLSFLEKLIINTKYKR